MGSKHCREHLGPGSQFSWSRLSRLVDRPGVAGPVRRPRAGPRQAPTCRCFADFGNAERSELGRRLRFCRTQATCPGQLPTSLLFTKRDPPPPLINRKTRLRLSECVCVCACLCVSVCVCTRGWAGVCVCVKINCEIQVGSLFCPCPLGQRHQLFIHVHPLFEVPVFCVCVKIGRPKIMVFVSCCVFFYTSPRGCPPKPCPISPDWLTRTAMTDNHHHSQRHCNFY